MRKILKLNIFHLVEKNSAFSCRLWTANQDRTFYKHANSKVQKPTDDCVFPGGAGSEVWNRVYMITPVKKFGRVRLSTNFPWKQIWRRMQTWKDDEFSLGFKFSRVQISREGFYDLFQWTFWTSGGVMYEKFMGDFIYRDSGSRQVQLFLSFVNFRASILLHFLYFSTYSSIKTLFIILNICYEHNILVWVLQQSYVNVH